MKQYKPKLANQKKLQQFLKQYENERLGQRGNK